MPANKKRASNAPETPTVGNQAASVVRARDVCAHARELRLRAAALVRESAEQRGGHAATWLSRFLCDDPLGPMVVCCAWCGRVRTTDGRLWLTSSAFLLELMATLRVSHGMCPSCRSQKWLTTRSEPEALLLTPAEAATGVS